MPGYELIDHDERIAVLDVFDPSGGVLFAHGFDKLRNDIGFENLSKSSQKTKQILL